jgi:tetrahydromethanopterin S-methyltransferase subunit G
MMTSKDAGVVDGNHVSVGRDGVIDIYYGIASGAILMMQVYVFVQALFAPTFTFSLKQLCL